MKLMIDTNADSKEDLLAARQLLESVLAKRGVVSNNQSYQSTNSENDRLQRKLAKAKAKEESVSSQAAPIMDMFGSNTAPESQQPISSQTESVPVMDMFGSSEPVKPASTDSENKESEDDDEYSNIQILPY